MLFLGKIKSLSEILDGMNGYLFNVTILDTFKDQIYTLAMKIFKWIYGKSKWIHKFVGLFMILFLSWSATSGIILNHPELVSGLSVPGWLVPSQYKTENWNRSSLIKFLFLKNNKGVGFLGGKKGIWKTVDGGKTFEKVGEGYTKSIYYGKVNDLYLLEEKNVSAKLFAASFGGLWVCDPIVGKWRKIFPKIGKIEIKKILKIDDKLIIFTQSEAYKTDLTSGSFEFIKLDLKKEGVDRAERVSLVRLFFDLHGGHIWGTIGRIFFDIIGLVIIFLSIFAFYIWYFPKRWKKRKIKKEKRRYLVDFFYKYHLKLGIWTALVMIVIGVTALFMRPPFLVLITRGDVDVSMYPGSFPDNPWDKKIHNALYLKKTRKILIETTDGMWEGDSDLKGKFKKIRTPVLVFVMGATVFEEYPEGGYIVGSFNGLFHVQEDGNAYNMISGKRVRFVSPVKPAEQMITGYFRTQDGEEYATAFKQGLIPLKETKPNRIIGFPEEIKNDNRLPLWNYMFELHNGRIFKDLIGDWYILIIPIGSILFLIVILTGIFDWFYIRSKKK